MLELKYKDLVVEESPIMINVDSYDEPSVLLRAWKTSRPDAKIDDNTINEILKLDLPINEMVHITMTCKVPVILREIITTLRDHIMWAKTSRVDKIDQHFEIYCEGMESKEDIKYVYDVMKKMIDAKENGEPQDSYRKYLPLSYMTSFTYKVSLRSLGKLLCHIAWISENYPVLKELYSDIMRENHGRLPDQYMEYLFEQSKKNHINYNEFNDFEEESVIQNQSYLSLNVKDISIGLRAQLVRSRSIQIQDNLLDAFSVKGWQSDNTMKLKVAISSAKSFFMMLVSKRNCWLAQKDLWEPILNLLNKELGDQVQLPCGMNGGKCPVYKDCMERLTGSDPGVPCPMMILMHKKDIDVPLTSELSSRMTEYAFRTNRCLPLLKATQKINDLLLEENNDKT